LINIKKVGFGGIPKYWAMDVVANKIILITAGHNAIIFVGSSTHKPIKNK
jgi:hypothetical protein